MKTIAGTVGRAAALAALALVATATTATGAQDQEPVRYVLSGAGGARILNFPDKKGLVVHELAADTPLAVYSEGTVGSYLKVAVPGGVRVWVYGQYLKPAERTGWLVVSGNQVQMRPLPSSGVNSLRVGKLYDGDRLRLIERQDPTKPMAEDWVAVWSPPDTQAWVLAAETRALPAGADGKALWSAAATEVYAAREARPAPGPAAGAAKEREPDRAMAAYRAADELARGLDGADPPAIEAVRAAFGAVLELKPDAPTRALVEQRQRELDLREELARDRALIALERQRREELRADYERQIAEASLKRDPLWGRFQERGWLEQSEISGQDTVYRVRWGGDAGPRVVCTSGRYDLSVFAGFELGIEGFPLRGAKIEGAHVASIDVSRIEVLSGRVAAKR